MKKRNLVEKALIDYRRWGEAHKDKTKYHRGGPNHHEWDEEIWEALNFDPSDEAKGLEDVTNGNFD